VFENRVLRQIFGPKRDEVIGDCRRLHNEEINDLYCSPNVIRVIKSRKTRCPGHGTYRERERGEREVHTGI
jgi:hypothetical protein